MSTVPIIQVKTLTYKHVNRIYGGRPEYPEISDSKKILCVPSTMDGTSLEPTIGMVEAHDSRGIQHIRVPDEPHVQGRVMESDIRQDQNRQFRNPAMEPTK